MTDGTHPPLNGQHATVQRPDGAPGADRANTLSPSLSWPTSNTASYEVKFLVRPLQAERVREWARQHLAVDPHADSSLGDAYRIHSVYFDTDDFAVFHQAPSYQRRKFRIRRYGSEETVYLERKTKSGDRVRKRRTEVAADELFRLRSPMADALWPADWFHRNLLARRLRPRCVIAYERIAYVGTNPDGPMRLTLDREIHCALTDGYLVRAATAEMPLLPEALILELKFRSAMPPLFKDLVAEMALSPGCISKYRMGIAAWGLAGTAKEVG